MPSTSGFGAKDSAGNWYFKALGDGEFLLGNTTDDTVEITGTLSLNHGDGASTSFQINGTPALSFQNKTTDIYIDSEQQDIDLNFGINNATLGRVTVLNLDASHAMANITKFLSYQQVTYDLGSGTTSTITPTASQHLLTATNIQATGGVHVVTLANGVTAGQVLQLILGTTTNNNSVSFNTSNIMGNWSMGVGFPANAQGAAIAFCWTGSAWVLQHCNNLTIAS